MHQAAISQASRPAPAPSSPVGTGSTKAVGNATVADKYVMDKYIADPNEKIATERDYWSAVNNLGQRYKDYKNKGNTGLENFGNFLAGLASVGEVDPTQQALGASVDNPNASWGVDPLGAALSIGGMMTGLPLGSTYALGKKTTGYTGPMIAFDGYNDLSPFSNSVSSPVGSGGSSANSSGASPSSGKGDQSGTIGSLDNVPILPTPSGAAPSNSNTPADEQTAAAPAFTMTPYPYDPLKFGETVGGWKFWPYGQPGLTAAAGGGIRGPGDGQNDKIPALLSDGEHVIDAGTVSALGNGSNEAGHRKIEALKLEVRKRAGYRNPKKIQGNIGSIGDLMRRAA